MKTVFLTILFHLSLVATVLGQSEQVPPDPQTTDQALTLLAPPPECFDEVARIKSNTRIRLIGVNAISYTGRLMSFDPETRILELTSNHEDGPYIRDIPLDLVDQIQYRGKGKIQGAFVFWGLLLGAATGALIGTVTNSQEGAIENDTAVTGAAIGGLAGMAIGAIVSTQVPVEKTILCRKKE